MILMFVFCLVKIIIYFHSMYILTIPSGAIIIIFIYLEIIILDKILAVVCTFIYYISPVLQYIPNDYNETISHTHTHIKYT